MDLPRRLVEARLCTAKPSSLDCRHHGPVRHSGFLHCGVLYMSGEETPMIDKVLAALVACLCLVVPVLPAWADEGTPESEEGRYTFSKIADGFIRLDLETARCRPAASGPSVGPVRQCQRTARCSRKRSGVCAPRTPCSSGISSRAGCPCRPGRCPSRRRARGWPRLHRGGSDFDRMMAFMGRVWHRLVEAIAQAQKQVLNKS